MTKILLVEDDKSLREIYGVRLLAEGYDIVSAGDGEEALAMAIKEKPQLIVSDVMMPKISGFDMLDILRSTTETRDIKVIMMTALSSDDQRARGEQLGADKYLVKSQVGIEDVVRTVHETLSDSAGSAKNNTSGSNADKDKPSDSGENKAEQKDGDTPDNQAPPSVNAEDNPANETASTDDNSNNTDISSVSDTPADTIDNTGSSENTDNAKEGSNMPPAGDDTAPTATTDSSDSVTSVTGNEDPGPLPPQPTEMESTLPQPTAPFSSPRPTNLGENAMNPTDSTNPVSDNGGAPVPPADNGGVPPVTPPVEPPAAPPVPEAPAPETPVPPAPEAPGEQQPPAAPPVPPAV